LPEARRNEQVESLVHYLLSLGPREPQQEFPTIGAPQRGQELFHQVGCAACHNSPQPGSPRLATSAPLPNLMEKYTLPSLTQFLLDPLHIRPAGRMPSLSLVGTEARDIASYLLKGLPEVANVKYAYYEGSFNGQPDFSKLTPKATGGTSRIDESLKQRGDGFGLRFEGFLPVDREGEYTFTLHSDDGSTLRIDGKMVVDNGGVHAPQTKQGRAKLTAGWHEVVIDFFEQGGGEELRAHYEGPGIPRRPIAESMSVLKEPPQKESLAIEIKPELVEQGRKLFASVGCASCHQLNDGDKQVTSQLAASALEKVNAAQGCLGETPGMVMSIKLIPHYGLSPRQRTSLRAAVNAQRKAAAAQPSPAEQIAHTMVRFNCCACHKRDQLGGVEAERDTFFLTTMKEMGDEGRLPPDLDGVGAKLTKTWLERVFDQGAHDRPYMHTRMPRFGMTNVGHLVSLLPQIDKLAPVAKLETELPLNRLKSGGWEMVGNKGFGCVKCHSFGPFPAEGIQAMDLALMRDRLNEDWFKRYVRNPQDFRRGTRMPSAWPPTGKKSLLKNILGGDVDTQIHGVWLYLADGRSARTPYGMVTGSQLLTPFNEAIIYRNFIQGAGPRGIGVGYPENRHLAFDANNMRIALIWQGSFINAQRHRSGRGEGFEPPAGSSLIKLPEGVTFARLPSADAPWPKLPAKEIGYQFRGYRLSKDQRPTFLYDDGPIHVEDFPTPLSTTKAITLGRTLTLKADEPVTDLYFRAAAGNIAAANDGWYTVDSALRVRVEAAGSKPILRKQGNQSELIVPVKFEGGQAKVVQEFAW
jgi:mono/diheme cytochrome c family protein